MTHLLALAVSLLSVLVGGADAGPASRATPAETIAHVTTADDVTARVSGAFTFDDLVALRAAARSRGISLEYTALTFGDDPREGYGDLRSISIAVAHDGHEGTAFGPVDNNRTIGFHVDLRESTGDSPFGVGNL